MNNAGPPLVFKPIASCRNPMEAEIFPAALREAEIPHRTEWSEGGELTILVASDWVEESREVLDRASEVFFGQTRERPGHVSDGKSEPRPEDEPEESDDNGGRVLFDAMPTPDETRIRAIWPAWLLAALPGLGLGHLYAGKFQIFFYLLFCSLLGFLFHEFTGSIWSFSINAFAWAVDLGFAAWHVKEHNLRAIRARKKLDDAERDFVRSL